MKALSEHLEASGEDAELPALRLACGRGVGDTPSSRERIAMGVLPSFRCCKNANETRRTGKISAGGTSCCRVVRCAAGRRRLPPSFSLAPDTVRECWRTRIASHAHDVTAAGEAVNGIEIVLGSPVIHRHMKCTRKEGRRRHAHGEFSERRAQWSAAICALGLPRFLRALKRHHAAREAQQGPPRQRASVPRFSSLGLQGPIRAWRQP